MDTTFRQSPARAAIDALLLEDCEDDRFLLERALRQSGLDFSCRWVDNRCDFTSALLSTRPDVVLVDGHLPDIEAPEALELVLRLRPLAPVVVVTGGLTDEEAAGLLRCGAQDYVLKDRLARLGPAVLGAIERSRALRRRCEDAMRLREALLGTIQAIARTCEKRDPYTAGHQTRVAALAAAIAREMAMEPDRIEGVRLGAQIHDIGKTYVPAEFLSRPGPLSRAEFEIIKAHAEIGYEIVRDIDFPWPVARMILQHHERLDGSGYPLAIAGDEIIPEARILAVADVLEAMMSHRPYRPSLGLPAALAELRSGSGKRFDPDVVAACMRVVEREPALCAPAAGTAR